MAENVLPQRYNGYQEANYKAEATTCGSTADSPGKFQELRPAENTVHTALLQEDSMQLKCFQSKAFC